MTRATFINSERQRATVLVYNRKTGKCFHVTAKSSHVIEFDVLAIGGKSYSLAGWTVAIKP